MQSESCGGASTAEVRRWSCGTGSARVRTACGRTWPVAGLGLQLAVAIVSGITSAASGAQSWGVQLPTPHCKECRRFQGDQTKHILRLSSRGVERGGSEGKMRGVILSMIWGSIILTTKGGTSTSLDTNSVEAAGPFASIYVLNPVDTGGEFGARRKMMLDQLEFLSHKLPIHVMGVSVTAMCSCLLASSFAYCVIKSMPGAPHAA